uniref:Mitochondrial import receptor subunit TOM40 n=1 Tax=Globisporangium ultimum (strain ATCC 200006 / CBS 805.95 / DAOM BR144) TaxID=431595 RepID=K3X883_GLOUD
MGAAPSKSERRARFPVLATSAAVPDEFELSSDTLSYMDQVAEIERERRRLPNPGLYENATNELKGPVSPDAFDGFRFDFTRILGQKFSTSHTFLLGTPMIPGGLYQFGANVVAGDAMDPSTFLMSKLSPDGYLDARWNQRLSSNWKMRVKSQLKAEEHASQVLADFDYMGEDFSWNMKISNGPLLGISYFQSITQHIALGGEGYYHGKHRKVIAAYCAKYSSPLWAGTATLGAMGTLQLQYLRKVGNRMRYGTEMVYNHASGESQTTIGVEVDLNQTHVVSSIDQTGRVATSVETRVLPNFMLTLSAEAFPAKDDFKFGYGAQITF